MSLVYDITFPSLPLSSIEISFYDCKERKNAGRGVEVVLVCVCVFGGGDEGLAEWPFALPCWLSCFCFAAWRRFYNKFDLPRPFLYSEIHNTTQHMHFIR